MREVLERRNEPQTDIHKMTDSTEGTIIWASRGRVIDEGELDVEDGIEDDRDDGG